MNEYLIVIVFIFRVFHCMVFNSVSIFAVNFFGGNHFRFLERGQHDRGLCPLQAEVDDPEGDEEGRATEAGHDASNSGCLSIKQ